VSDLLPPEGRIRWILEKGARLLEGGAEPVAGLVLPTGKFFPDHFERSEKGVARLLRRVVKHAGLSDMSIKSRLVVPEQDELGGGGCSSGACGTGGGGGGTQVQRVEESSDGYTVNLMANELSNPVVLTTGMVRAVSHIFMKELGLYQDFDRSDAEAGSDLCGVLLGFGVLLANGAYIYKKG
jgi:hypothetical protein